MGLQIRRGIFETNSSSSHSISVIGGDRYTDKSKLYVNPKTHVIEVTGDEYGWDANPCRLPIEKLDYIVTYISQLEGLEDSVYFKWLSEMVKDYTGYPLEFVGDEYDIFIDHQSFHLLSDFLPHNEKEFKEKTKELVFNDKYSIVISNDNSYF